MTLRKPESKNLLRLDDDGLNAVVWALFAITAVFVLLRGWTSIRVLRRKLDIQDYCLFVSLALLGAMIGCWVYGLSALRPRPGSSPDPAILTKGLKVAWACTFLYYCILCAAKVSFLSMYFKMVQPLETRLKPYLLATAIYVGLGTTTVVLMKFFWCHPFTRAWDLKNFCSPCTSQTVVTVAFTLNFTSDLAILAFPFFVMHRLFLHRLEMLGLLFLVSLGVLSIGASIVRFVFLYTSSIKGNDSIMVLVMSVMEVVAAMLAACAPAARTCWREWKKRANRSGPPEKGKCGVFEFGTTSGESGEESC